jgi:hypothetical protein
VQVLWRSQHRNGAHAAPAPRLEYVERIARLRAYYFDHAPELTHYLASVPPSRRLAIQGFGGSGWLIYRTIPGMLAAVTAVLTGSAAGLIATIAAGHSAAAGFVTGGVVGAAVLAALMWYQYRAWTLGVGTQLFEDEQKSLTQASSGHLLAELAFERVLPQEFGNGDPGHVLVAGEVR